MDITSALVLSILLDRLRQMAPGVDVRVSHVNVERVREPLDEGALRIAIVGSGDHPERFAVRHLLPEPLPCMAAETNDGLRDPMSLEQFADLLHIVVAPSSTHRSLIEHLLTARNLLRRNLVRTLQRFGRFRSVDVPLEGACFDYLPIWHQREAQTAVQQSICRLVMESMPQPPRPKACRATAVDIHRQSPELSSTARSGACKRHRTKCRCHQVWGVALALLVRHWMSIKSSRR